MKSRRLRAFDRKLLQQFEGVIGIDEAGRGALAGPVVAAAVAAPRDFYDEEWCRRNASRINDSKLLTRDEREDLYDRLRWLERGGRIWIGVGKGSVEDIAQLNILGATQLAMRDAAESVFDQGNILPHDPDPLFVSEDPPEGDGNERLLSNWKILVDGKPEGLVKGDSRSLCIAMASIIAKVTRDRLMMALDCDFPHYDLASSKGYATSAHREAILANGATPIHRALFLRNLLEEKAEIEQDEFGF